MILSSTWYALDNGCRYVTLNITQIFDYATNNVRANATRAIHQLVECVANANPYKTLAKVRIR
jgi:hypothetical protein